MTEVQKEEKDQKQNQLKWHMYLVSILFILVGVLFVVYNEIDVFLVCKLFAAVFAVAGIVSVLSYIIRDVASGYYRLDLVYGIMSLFAALLFITDSDKMGAYFSVIIGVILVGNGVIKLQHSIDMKRIDRKMKKVTEMWLVVMIFALAGIAAGLIAVYLKLQEQSTLFMIVGIAFIIAGASDIFTHIVFNSKVRAFRNMEEVADEAGSEESVESGDSTETEPVSEEPATGTKDTADDDKPLFEVETSEDNKDDTDQSS